MAYEHKEIEKKWRERWRDLGTYRVENDATKPKYYVLDMFPYPSGAGLHVGHPLGYIASDIVARFKRHSGFNVLHPMGYDSFGLPAEQYAIQTGQHPAKTTEVNIARYREQLDRIGFSFDWSREVRTSDPAYYRWTQWVFLQLFDSWYNIEVQRAEPISSLIRRFEHNGFTGIDRRRLTGDEDMEAPTFTAAEWKAFNPREQEAVLQYFRLAYRSEAWVNWCPALGTVLANDEVKDGVSERGGHPVERKRMPQWSMRITAYAQRLLDSLDELDWSESIKEAQRNWIGRSRGALVKFALTPSPSDRERGMEDRKHAFMTADPVIAGKLMEHANSMRKNPTPAEDLLWQLIRGNATGGRIRRQHIIERFIVDFVSLPKQLVIEVDGDIHDLQKDEDAARTVRLNELGFEVIRFRNEEVISEPTAARERIIEALRNRPDFAKDEDLPDFGEAHSSPSPWEKGLGDEGLVIEVFTTRPDTLFGVTFVTLAPEHQLVDRLVTPERRAEVMAYCEQAKNRSERDRMADVKSVSGAFTGAYVKHPFTGADVPVWVGDYVLVGYATGAVMAVPGGDQRDWNFAKHFNLPIIAVTEGADIAKEADERKDAILINSGFLNGLEVPQAITRAIQELETLGVGEGRINYRLRDAAFGRQRYWGEPIPIYYEDGLPKALPDSALPLRLPEVDKFLPTADGEPPLARADRWSWDSVNQQLAKSGIGNPLETTTMPGWAGSSWYWLRYMDPANTERFAGKEAVDYWKQVDLYLGGSEHATGHLLYVRFWTKFLFDRGHIAVEEPAQKLVNQGMIQGMSMMAKVTVDRSEGKERYQVLSKESTQNEGAFDRNYLIDHVTFKEGRYFIDEDGAAKTRSKEATFREFYLEAPVVELTPVVEKMSKSKFNVVNPDDIIEKYGADTLRLYEMFLGPLEQSKPWDTNGIEGTFRFLRKFWNLFYSGDGVASTHGVDLPNVSEDAPSKAELKALHATLKKVTEDIEKLSFNTSVSQFMIAVNELGALKCHKRDVLEPLTIALAPFAPHIAEELWSLLGHTDSITTAPWPQWQAEHLVEDSFSYPISFNGKTRLQLEFPMELDAKSVEAAVLANREVQARLEGKLPKKVIVVPKRIVNIVV
jgi:leucyl-tRNA synthetase